MQTLGDKDIDMLSSNLAIYSSNTLDTKFRIPEPLSLLALNIKSCYAVNHSANIIMNNVANVLQEFGNKGIEATLNDMLRNESSLVEFAKMAYLHKNGFYKIILINDNHFKIRLHLWMPGVISKETLHNHRWHIASTVLNGKLQSEIWDDSVSIHAKHYDEYLYTSKHVKPTLIGKTKVELIKTIIHQTGDAYTLEPHILHRIITSGNEMIATLICRSSSTRGWSRNIIVNDQVPDVIPNYLSADDLFNVLNNYLKLNAKQ